MTKKKFKPEAILIMKVGFHGDENISEIIARKKEEEKKVGFIFWGYGGVLCHPIRVVQKFASNTEKKNGQVKVLFSITKSPFHSTPSRAKKYSEDGIVWKTFSKSSNVLSSKFALVIKNLKECDETVCLNDYCVGGGPSQGRGLHEYLKYRVDKAVARERNGNEDTRTTLSVQFTADLVFPFAVLVDLPDESLSRHPSQTSLPY